MGKFQSVENVEEFNFRHRLDFVIGKREPPGVQWSQNVELSNDGIPMHTKEILLF
jgi:hypothetical protein